MTQTLSTQTIPCSSGEKQSLIGKPRGNNFLSNYHLFMAVASMVLLLVGAIVNANYFAYFIGVKKERYYEEMK